MFVLHRRTARLLPTRPRTKAWSLHCYATNACRHCAIKHNCTARATSDGSKRWEHEHIIEVVRAPARCAPGEDAAAT